MMTQLQIHHAAPAPPTAIAPELRAKLHRVAGWAIFLGVVVAALATGLLLRRWAWDQTEPIRFVMDINNAFRQGTFALKTGFINRYDEAQANDESQDQPMGLDYAPGRLAVATLWTRWVRLKVGEDLSDLSQLQPWPQQFYNRARAMHMQYELVKPLLMVNLTGEILSAVAMFFLVKRYTAGKPPNILPLRGNILGLVAALFFWFDPALIWNAHCWPQWDSWVLPFFLWALVLASWNRWFCSGLVIAAGAMFKGQILFGAPVFLLWPLFQGRLPALSRWIIGLMTATTVITAVWLVRVPGTNPTGDVFLSGHVSDDAIAWLIYFALLFASITVIVRWPLNCYARIPIAMLLAAIVIWSIGLHTNRTFSLLGFLALAAGAWYVDDQRQKWSWQIKLPLAWLAAGLLIYPVWEMAREWVIVIVIATIAVVTLLALAPRRVLPFAAAGWMSAALLMCMPVFNTSHGWFDLGFAYGTHHYERIASGQIDNLPELMQYRWGWDDLMAPVFTLPPGHVTDHIAKFLREVDPGVHYRPGAEITLPLKYFLLCIWLIALTLCGFAAAVHDTNRSPRFLAAICAPWIVLFAVMTQMHQRYLLWGASLSSAAAVLSPGYAILHLFLSIVSASQEMQSMMDNPYDPANHGQYTHYALYQFVDNWHPGIAWAVLLTAGIFLYTAIRFDRKKPAMAMAQNTTSLTPTAFADT